MECQTWQLVSPAQSATLLSSEVSADVLTQVPNYLTYVNSVLFYRVGGGSRLSGIMLAIGTGLIMMVGPRVIGYLRECPHHFHLCP